MSESNEYFVLTVITGDKAAENFILDSQYHRIATGLGERCTFRLPGGVYSVKVKAGSLSTQKPVVLYSDQTVVFDLLKFWSPAPLEDTSQTTGFQADTAVSYSKREQADVSIGTGSKLFLFGTIYDNRELEVMDQSRDPAIGLTLRNSKDEVLVDFGDPAIGTYSFERNPWAACEVDVEPGIYTLCVETAAKEVYKHNIVACRNWQTQVFFQPKDYGTSERDIRADLITSSVFMSRLGEGFNAGSRSSSLEDPDFRLTELLRQGLISKRNIVSEEVYSSLSSPGLKDPMRGIYAAHMLVLNGGYNREELKAIVENLRSLLGRAHPDVEAIACKLDLPSDFLFDTFPMLASSWQFALDRSITNKQLIPEGSLAYKLAGQFWNCDLWLVWGMEQRAALRYEDLQLESVVAEKMRLKDQARGSLLEKIIRAGMKLLPFLRERLDDPEKLWSVDTLTTLSKSLGIPKGRLLEVLKSIDFKDIKARVETKLKAEKVANDPQKGQWGGKPEVNSRRLSATVEAASMQGFYKVTLLVESTSDQIPLTGEVRFYLHDTFYNPERVEKVKEGKAVLELHGVWGSFTVGAVADNGATELELDLAELPGITEEFRNN